MKFYTKNHYNFLQITFLTGFLTLFLTLFLTFSLFFSKNIYAQDITVSNYYKTDADGDGVPDVRDHCPDTDKNLNGRELPFEFNGKIYKAKIADFKGNLDLRRRRIMVEYSRMDKEKVALLKAVNKDKNLLSETARQRVAEIDTAEAKIKRKLADLTYEAKIKIDGKDQLVDVPIRVDEFGCLPDKDNDGVPDLVDACPELKGIPALNGCNDRDGDKVLDHEDDCPDEPGLIRLKGCPDKGLGDRDGDGTIDKDDLCPDVKGPKENKGCPELVDNEQKKIVDAASRVLFEVAKADLKAESFAILDKLVGVIQDLNKKYGKIAIRLDGHTDSDGSDEDNLELSRNRSRSVKDYLASKGIDVNNIATAGYGEGKPSVPNTTPQNKQKNRRVEITFSVIK